MKKILLYFLSWKLLVLTGAFLATFLAPISYKFTAAYDFGLRLPYYLWIWGNFDGTHYLEIARNGYHHLEYPFFPLLPLVIRSIFLSFDIFKIYIPFVVIGVTVTNLAFFVGLFIAVKLLIVDGKKSLIPLFLIILITYPTSFFYGAVYNDSLFFMLATATIFFSRKRNFVAASILGALASLTRLNGLALMFIVVFEYLAGEKNEEEWNFKKLIIRVKSRLVVSKIVASKIYFLILIPFAFFGYLSYVRLISGGWQTMFKAMSVWNQGKATFPLQVLYRYVKIVFLASPNTTIYWVAMFELLSVLFYVAMLIYSYKKIRLSYWLFFAVSILIPSITGTFAGMPRYGLHIYPFFLSITVLLQSKPSKFKLAYFAISIILFLFAITLFTRGYFVS